MTDRDTILLAEHQRLRSEGVKPGSDEYERTLEAVANAMQERKAPAPKLQIVRAA